MKPHFLNLGSKFYARNILFGAEIACTELLLWGISSIKVFALTFSFDAYFFAVRGQIQCSEFTRVTLLCITNNMSDEGEEITKQTISHEPQPAPRWTYSYKYST